MLLETADTTPALMVHTAITAGVGEGDPVDGAFAMDRQAEQPVRRHLDVSNAAAASSPWTNLVKFNALMI